MEDTRFIRRFFADVQHIQHRRAGLDSVWGKDCQLADRCSKRYYFGAGLCRALVKVKAPVS